MVATSTSPAPSSDPQSAAVRDDESDTFAEHEHRSVLLRRLPGDLQGFRSTATGIRNPPRDIAKSSVYGSFPVFIGDRWFLAYRCRRLETATDRVPLAFNWHSL